MDMMKKKKIGFIAIIVMLFVLCVGCNFYTRDAYASNIYFTNNYMILERIYNNHVIEQEFTLKEGDQGVGVLFGTYVTVLDHGSVEAELFDENGQKVAEMTVPLEGTQDNNYMPFCFNGLDSYFGQKCMIRLTFNDIDDQLIAVYGSWTDTEKYNTEINGEYRPENIALNGLKETTYLEYRDIRLLYVLVIGIFMAYWALYKIKWQRPEPKQIIVSVKETLWSNKKHIIRFLITIVGCCALSAIMEYSIYRTTQNFNPYRMLTYFVVSVIIALAIVFKNHIWDNAHWFFFMVCMLIGSVYILSTPPTPLCWDEQLHYTKTAYMSWGATNKISVGDYMMHSMYTQQHYYDIFQKSERLAWVEEANVIDGRGGFMGYLEGVSVSSVAYAITSMVLYATRLLGFEFITRYTLGKMTNLFLYALFLAISIKLFKGRGKLLVAMIGLIPTNILMASSYGYDWWVIALVILGYAIFIHELQAKGYVSTGKVVLSTCVMGVGILAKAVYFPLMLPLMMLKKDKYKEAKKSRVIVILGMFFLVASFLLPLLISSSAGAVAGGGDYRGGLDVNAGEQVIYILTNLKEYLTMLFNFMLGYLHPDAAKNYLTEIPYRSNGGYFTVCMIIIAIASAIDNSDELVFHKKNKWAVVGGYLGVLGALVLVVTALYVSYTAVGAGSVKGCQPRYILPVLFPFLYFMGENRMTVPNDTKRKAFVWGVLGMALVFLNMIYNVYVVRYCW